MSKAEKIALVKDLMDRAAHEAHLRVTEAALQAEWDY